MNSAVRTASLLLIAGLLLTPAVRAQAGTRAWPAFPYYGNCTIPTYLDLYACRNGLPDPAAGGIQNRVVLRDVGNYPMVGYPVTIMFCTDVKIYGSVPGHPELEVTCGSPTTIRGYSDAAGVVQFFLIGASVNTNGSARGTGANCATITIGEGGGTGSYSSPATVTVYDENGAVSVQSVEGGDLAGWLGDFGKKAVIGYKGRSDYSHNAMVEGADLSLWLKVFGLGNSSQSPGSLCP